MEIGTGFKTGKAHRPGKYAGARSIWTHRWSIVATILLAAAAIWGTLRLLIGPEVAVYPVIRGNLVRTVVVSGHVETPFRVNIGSQITGTVKDVLVDEGQTVKQGQPLVELDPVELNAAVTEARSAVAQAEARMRQLQEYSLPAAQESLKQAQANLAVAETSFRRADRLMTSGAGSRAAYEDATKNLNVAQTQARSAELQVYALSEGGSDYELARTGLDQARASLASAQARLAHATIASPRDGVLITRSVERGAVVQPGTPLLVLAPTGDIQLVLQIDEKNLGLIRLGQTALASADAYPDDRFTATLTYINPSVDIARASLEVKLTVDDPPPYLRQDMTVSVDIAVDRRQSTLIVPAKVVHDPASAAPWVLVVRDGRVWEQAVTVGLRAGDRIEILSGLSDADLVVPTGAGVRAGQRIRAVQP